MIEAAVLDFCAEQGIQPDIKVIPIQEVNRAHKDVENGDVRFRYVINMGVAQGRRGQLS